ncbi:hypothetical protein P3S68_007318 [Capsicum galapagoense]
MKSSSLWTLPILLFSFSIVVSNNGVLHVASHKVYMHLQSTSPVDVNKVHRTGYHFGSTIQMADEEILRRFFRPPQLKDGYYVLENTCRE